MPPARLPLKPPVPPQLPLGAPEGRVPPCCAGSLTGLLRRQERVCALPCLALPTTHPLPHNTYTPRAAAPWQRLPPLLHCLPAPTSCPPPHSTTCTVPTTHCPPLPLLLPLSTLHLECPHTCQASHCPPYLLLPLAPPHTTPPTSLPLGRTGKKGRKIKRFSCCI